MQHPHRTAKALIADNTITVDELWTQWWANGGWAGPNDFGIYLNAHAWSDAFDLEVLAAALDDLDPGRRSGVTPGAVPPHLGPF
ncbi:hypothetical protein M1D89_01700 (plasmid) [Arthrobacter sp. D3-18]